MLPDIRAVDWLRVCLLKYIQGVFCGSLTASQPQFSDYADQFSRCEWNPIDMGEVGLDHLVANRMRGVQQVSRLRQQNEAANELARADGWTIVHHVTDCHHPGSRRYRAGRIQCVRAVPR